MLILTRSITQTITIGDDISVSILGVKGNQVRIGIDAPKDVSVHRSEIYDRILNEHRAANTAPKARPEVTSDAVSAKATPKTIAAAPKSDLYDTLVAKQSASDNERSSKSVKTTTITVKKRRKVAI